MECTTYGCYVSLSFRGMKINNIPVGTSFSGEGLSVDRTSKLKMATTLINRHADQESGNESEMYLDVENLDITEILNTCAKETEICQIKVLKLCFLPFSLIMLFPRQPKVHLNLTKSAGLAVYCGVARGRGL